jgi:Spy/CpxP family protein refolding chaperone
VGASTASAQGRPGGFGGRGGGGVGALLMIAEVQKELNITDDQKTKLREAIGGGGGRGDFQNLSREEIQKRIEEAAKKAEETVKTVLDAKQQERLGELRIQRDGAVALARAEVAEKIGLDQAQKDKIKKVQEESAANRPNFPGQNATEEERTKARDEARKAREKVTTEILAVLSPQQKEAFEKLQGAKFEFPAQQFGGRPRNNN